MKSSQQDVKEALTMENSHIVSYHADSTMLFTRAKASCGAQVGGKLHLTRAELNVASVRAG